jgi:translocation and assembly module TamA
MRPLTLLLLTGSGLTACASQPKGRQWVDQLEIVGTQQLSKSKVLEGLATRPTPWWWWVPLIGERRWYSPAALDTDLQRIERYYASKGFFSAKVLDERVRPKRDGRAVDVQLEVEEGKPTTITSIEIEGIDALPAAEQRHVVRDLPLKLDQRFDHEAYSSGKGLLCGRLRDRGYAYAQCQGEVRVDREAHRATVQYRIEPGPKVKMGPVQFEGAEPIPVDKLRSAVSWDEGETYRVSEITRTRARLFRHRVFSQVKISLPKEPTAVAPIKVELSPTKLRELRLGGGFGVDPTWQEVHLFGRWTWRNFLGGLRELEARLRPRYAVLPTVWADEQRRGFAGEAEIQLTQPDMLGSGITAFGTFGYDLGLDQAYRYHGPRLQFGADRTFARDLIRSGLSWNFNYLEFFALRVDSLDPFDNPLGPGIDGTTAYRLAWLEPFVSVDWRDDIIDPRAGLFGELRLELGFPQIGGAFTYIKVTPDVRGYIPLGTKRLVLALRALFSHIVPLDDGQSEGSQETSPVTRRIWFGGANNHRGFNYRRLSPQVYETERVEAPDGGVTTNETGDLVTVGGDSALLLSADLRLRMTRLWGNWLQLIAFFDAGDVVGELDQLGRGGLHLAVGGGLQYQTMIGALGLSFGYRLNRQRTARVDGRPIDPDPDSPFALHFTLGGAF